MSRKCDLLKAKAVMVGNNVSHSKRRTKTRFLPNLHEKTLFSDVLGKVKVRIASTTLRTVDHNGGIDEFLKKTALSKLASKGVELKKRLLNSKKFQENQKTA